MRNVKIKSYDRNKPSGEACIGFIALSEHIMASFSRAKKICKQMGGSLPYFDNNEDYWIFLDTQHDMGRVDWLGIRKVGSRDIFKTVAPAKNRKEQSCKFTELELSSAFSKELSAQLSQV
jgi:hypothetical protein